MASNQTNRFQSLDSSVEEFIDGQENENRKKKTKHDVALFNGFLVLKGETRQMDELTPQELNKFLSEFLIDDFHNGRRRAELVTILHGNEATKSSQT